MTCSEEAQQVTRLGWGGLSVRRSRLGHQPAGSQEKGPCRAEPTSLSPRLHWDRGGTGATGWGRAGLRLPHEAHHTRRSSEAALGVFSRIRGEKLFFFQFLEVLHIDAEVQSALEGTNTRMHTCAHTHTSMSFACAQPSYPYL